MKKLISLLTLSLFSSVLTMNVQAEEYAFVDAPYLNLSAEVKDSHVNLTWNSSIAIDDFSSWRLLSDTTFSNLTYPDNFKIFYDFNESTKSYIDTIPASGSNYYRICAITKNLTQYCSSIITANVGTGHNEYKPVQIQNSMNFAYNRTEDGINFTWGQPELTDDQTFAYYFLSKNKTEPPLFPDDSYIFYSNYVETDEYLEETEATEGEAYYRLCVITLEADRICSSPLTVDYSDPITEAPTKPTDSAGPGEGDNPEPICDANSADQACDTNTTPAFSDIAESPYYDAITYVKNNNIVDGYADGTFRPNDYINRAEFSKILANAVYSDNLSSKVNCFTDVQSEWYASYVCTLKDQGIVEGYSNGSFLPANNINAVEALKMTLLAYDANLPQTLIAVEPWYAPYWSYAVSNGILPETIYSADQLITRGEMAQIIYLLNQSN